MLENSSGSSSLPAESSADVSSVHSPFEEVLIGGVLRRFKLDPSSEHTLLSASRLANAEFPQAYLVQGIRLAEAMVGVFEQGVPMNVVLDAFVDLNTIDEAKRRAHAAHGFATVPSNRIFTVWSAYNSYATRFLYEMGKRLLPGRVPFEMDRQDAIVRLFEVGGDEFVTNIDRKSVV